VAVQKRIKVRNDHMEDERKIKKSRWVHIYGPKRGVYSIFHSKNLKIFIVNKEVINLIKYLNKPRYTNEVFSIFGQKNNFKKIIRVLVNNDFLINSSEDEIKNLKKWISKERQRNVQDFGRVSKINALRVIVTEKCNMKCNYCFVRNQPIKKAQTISIKSLINGIDFLSSLNKNETIELQFFGGEPLLEFELIKKAVTYAEQLKNDKAIDNVLYGITINGTLITKEHSEFFKKNNFLVSISIDGPELIHNSNRIYNTDNGSYRDVIKGLNLLKKYNNDIGILITPSQNNINQLANSCEYLIDKLKCKFITINTPQPLKGNWDIDGKSFSHEIKKCIEVAKKYEATINHFGTRVFYGLNINKPLIFSCSKFGDNYTATITPDGYIGPCIVSWHHKKYLSHLENFNLNKFVEWKLYSPLYFNKCTNCPAMNICGGPCPLEIYEMEKLSKPVDHERCKFFEDFLEWAMWYKN